MQVLTEMCTCPQVNIWFQKSLVALMKQQCCREHTHELRENCPNADVDDRAVICACQQWRFPFALESC
jgi:hypothetical protein